MYNTSIDIHNYIITGITYSHIHNTFTYTQVYKPRIYIFGTCIHTIYVRVLYIELYDILTLVEELNCYSTESTAVLSIYFQSIGCDIILLF